MKEDFWSWKEDLVPVPGFGFLPPKVDKELEKMTEVNKQAGAELGQAQGLA